MSYEAACLGKIKWRSKRAAKRSMRRSMAAFGGRRWNVYRCAYCLRWHFGHLPEGVKRQEMHQ